MVAEIDQIIFIFCIVVCVMKLTFVTSGLDERSERVASKFRARYGDFGLEKAQCVVVLGGDGLVLKVAHDILNTDAAIYGINMGNVGFLTNFCDNFDNLDIFQKINAAKQYKLPVLEMYCMTQDNKENFNYAINDVYLIRKTHQTAKFSVNIDDFSVINEFSGDGFLVSTPVGSTAYNYSLGGPILPVDSNFFALTPISPFRPRHLRSAILQDDAKIRFEIFEHRKRPVNVVCDFVEFHDVLKCSVSLSKTLSVPIFFDFNNDLKNKVFFEQFM